MVERGDLILTTIPNCPNTQPWDFGKSKEVQWAAEQQVKEHSIQ
jgi:hypothetical protein